MVFLFIRHATVGVALDLLMKAQQIDGDSLHTQMQNPLSNGNKRGTWNLLGKIVT